MQTNRQDNSATVEDFINRQPEHVRTLLSNMRNAIRKAAPDAQEVISYQMPAYKYHGMLAYFNAWSNHCGLYIMPHTMEAFREKLHGYKLSKSAIQIPFDKPLPDALVHEIISFAVRYNLQKAEMKVAAKKVNARKKG